jgi:hypothetical protein
VFPNQQNSKPKIKSQLEESSTYFPTKNNDFKQEEGKEEKGYESER